MKPRERIKQDANTVRPSRVSQRKSAFTRRRKNFLPTLILAILTWAAWGWLVYTIPPASHFSLITFGLLLFLAIFLTTALLLANSRRGFLTAMAVIGLLALRYYELANFLNLALFLSILISLGLYFKKADIHRLGE